MWSVVLVTAGLVAAPMNLAHGEQKTEGWTLQRLAAAALAQNPGLAAARTNIAATNEDINAARGGFLPKVDAVSKLELFPNRSRLLIERHGFRRDDNPFETAIINYGLEVRMPLYTSGRLEQNVTLAEAKSKAADAARSGTRGQLLFNIASGYYTALRLQKVIKAQRAILRSLRESFRVGQLQTSVGRIASLDLLRLRTRLSQARRDLTVAQVDFDRTLEFLKALINLPVDRTLTIAGELVPGRYMDRPQELRRYLLSNRPDIARLRHLIGAQEAAVKVAESALGPKLDLRARYRGATGFDDSITKDAAEIFFEFRVPLYSGGVLRARTRKETARLRVLKFRLSDLERRALSELERALLTLRASDPRIKAARQAQRQAGETLRVERQRFAEGRGTSNDLLLAIDSVLRARTQLAAALSGRRIAIAALNLAVGQNPIAEDTLVRRSPQ